MRIFIVLMLNRMMITITVKTAVRMTGEVDVIIVFLIFLFFFWENGLL